jgi:type III pantothenate kinase
VVTLALDIGNSKIKAGLFDGRELLKHASFNTLGLQKLEAWWQPFRPEKGIYSTTRKELPKFAGQLAEILPMTELHFSLPLPVKLKYETPETLGKDRIAGAAGAQQLFPGHNVLVLDLGTCITYDMVTAEGSFIGGQISPGWHMRLKAMQHFTARLPLAPANTDPDRIGSNTTANLQSGAFHGMLHEMDGFISWYSQNFDNLKVIITGGDAPNFAPHLKNEIFAAPNLILQGLNHILLYQNDRDN